MSDEQTNPSGEHGNKPLEECASTRYQAYTFARDKIWEALEEGGSE